MNHFGIGGQETMTLFRNAIEIIIDMKLRLRLDLHSPVNVELPRTLVFIYSAEAAFLNGLTLLFNHVNNM